MALNVAALSAEIDRLEALVNILTLPSADQALVDTQTQRLKAENDRLDTLTPPASA